MEQEYKLHEWFKRSVNKDVNYVVEKLVKWDTELFLAMERKEGKEIVNKYMIDWGSLYSTQGRPSVKWRNRSK